MTWRQAGGFCQGGLNPQGGGAGPVRPCTKVTRTTRDKETPGGRIGPPGLRQPRPAASEEQALRGKGALPLPSAGTARLGKPSLLTPRICVRLGHCVLLKYIYVPLGSAESPLKRFTRRDGTAAALCCNLMHWGEKIEGAYYCA